MREEDVAAEAAAWRGLLQPMLDEERVKQADVADRLSELVGRNVEQSTVSRWIAGTVPRQKQLQEALRHMLEEMRAGVWPVAGETPEAAAHRDELDEWIEGVEHTVRFAGGSQNLTPEERKRIQRDVLSGVIRLGKAEGKDVRRLEEMLHALGPAPVGGRISIAEVYELYREDLAVARERAAGMKELAIAARIAEEEGVRRSERLDRIEQMAATAPQPAITTRGLLDLQAAEGADEVSQAAGDEERLTG